MTTNAARLNVHAEQEELFTLEEVRRLFEVYKSQNLRPKLVGPEGEIDLPESLYSVLREVVPLLLQRRSVSILPDDEELTTQQAADILNVSRQHVVNLITASELPAHKVGTHRRIYMRDVLDYRECRRAAENATLDELARFSLDEGMYDKRKRTR